MYDQPARKGARYRGGFIVIVLALFVLLGGGAAVIGWEYVRRLNSVPEIVANQQELSTASRDSTIAVTITSEVQQVETSTALALSTQTQATLAALQQSQAAGAQEVVAVGSTVLAQQTVLAEQQATSLAQQTVLAEQQATSQAQQTTLAVEASIEADQTAVPTEGETTSVAVETIPLVVNERPNPAPLGWPYEQDQIAINLVKVSVRRDADNDRAALEAWFTLTNKSAHDLTVEADTGAISFVDVQGNRYVDWEGSKLLPLRLQSGSFIILSRYYSITPGERSRVPPDGFPLVGRVEQLGSIQGAQWQIGGTPMSTVAPSAQLGSIGGNNTRGNFQITLSEFEIRTIADNDRAAFFATFEVKNIGSQREILALDFGEIFAEDDRGTRYIDWEGGGYIALWLDAGKTYTVSRYYTTQYQERSRVADGVELVYFVIGGDREPPLQWMIPARY